MKNTPFPTDEKKRLLALKKLNILDTKPEQEFDEISELASIICDTPVALISLLDKERQWFKSCIGTRPQEEEYKYSFCKEAIKHDQKIFEVSDAQSDPRFKDNPYTFGENPIIFYAGVPLRNEEGYALGTLCVVDDEPRKLTEKQQKSLVYLANQVVKLFELRTKNNGLRETQKLLREKNTQLKNFAGVVSHDMKMPLANMIVTIDILKSKYLNDLDESGKEYLSNLKQSAFKLSDYITNILAHYESDSITEENTSEHFELNELLEEIIDILDINDDCEINFPRKNHAMHCNRIALEQILLNLIGNSVKYNDKDTIRIDIDCVVDDFYYHFTIKDNGIGIPEEKQNEVFNLFQTATDKDRKGNQGNGIGLSTVKKLVHNLGGEINLESEVGKYTKFKFQVER
ncbi:MAG: sensor histidine kinase [Bacteroidota bacterium]